LLSVAVRCAVPTPFKCIVLDDDPESLELLARHFAECRPPVIANEFLSGFRALEFLERNHVDFILTDLRMPEMDGLTFVEEVRQFDKTTPIIVMCDDESVAAEAFTCGANAFVEKRVFDTTLMRAVEAIISEIVHHEKTTEH
jgi:two-component system, response regulator YesN